MFTNSINRLILGMLMTFCVVVVHAQDFKISEAEIQLSKDVRKAGSYVGGGYDHEKNEIVTIFKYPGKKDDVLFDVYRFDGSNKPLEPQIGLDLAGLSENLTYESTDTDQKKENVEYDGSRVLLVRPNFIGRNIIIERGVLEHEQELLLSPGTRGNPFHNSRAWVLDRLLYNSEEKEQVKLDMMPIGTLVSKGQFPADALNKIREASSAGPSSTSLIGAMAGGIKSAASAIKAGPNAAFMQEGGQAVVIGRVVEKVSIKDPVPWNNNRLRIATVDGTNMTAEEKATIAMPFAFLPAHTKAIDNFQRLVTLLVPLNSPNTVKEAKQYQMDKENRNRVMVTIVTAEGEVSDTLEYRSAGNNGKYDIQEEGASIYIPAVVDAGKSGFYNGIVNKPTHFQITKVANGKVQYNRAYAFDDISGKAIVPKGEKFKKFSVGDVQFQGHQVLENGDVAFYAVDENAFYVFQVAENGDLKQVYLNERFDTKGKIVDSKFTIGPKGKMVWITRETPEGVTDTEVDISEGYSSVSAIARNVMEIKAVTQLMYVDPLAGTLGAQAIIGGKDYLVVGDAGYLVSKDGEMVMIGYDLEKKKSLHAIRLSY